MKDIEKNLFSLKKERKVSRFPNAVMIVEKDRGKGTSKRFLFDANATKALELLNGAELGFILVDKYPETLFMADLKDVDKEKFNISEDDINKVNKTKVRFDEYPEDDFLYVSFSNKQLFDRISEEFEIETEYNQKFNIHILNIEDTQSTSFEDLREYVGTLGLKKLYILEYAGSINNIPKWKIKFKKGSIGISNPLDRYWDELSEDDMAEPTPQAYNDSYYTIEESNVTTSAQALRNSENKESERGF